LRRFFFFIGLAAPLKPGALVFLINIILPVPLLYGIYQFSALGISRPYSFFGNPIFFAEILSALTPLLLYSLTQKGRLRYLSVFNLALTAPCLIICSSRGVFISLLISLFVLAFYFLQSGIRPVFNRRFFAALLLLLAVPFIIPGFSGAVRSGTIRSISLFTSGAPEIKDRLLLTRASAEIFLDFPAFGAGPGAVRQQLQLKEAGILAKDNPYRFVNSSFSHNDYMQLLAETGIIGVLLYIAFIFTVAAAFEAASPKMNGSTLLFTSSCFCSLIFMFSESFFNFPLFSMPSSALIFTLAGMIISRTAALSDKGACLSRPVYAAAVCLFLMPALIYISCCKPGAFAANFYLKDAVQSVNNGSGSFNRALTLEPDNFFASAQYARSLTLNGWPNMALDKYNILLKYFPNSADIIYDMGLIYLSHKDFAKADAYFERAIYYYPGFAAAHLGLFKAEHDLFSSIVDLRETTE
jgi:O-antigen ligase